MTEKDMKGEARNRDGAPTRLFRWRTLHGKERDIAAERLMKRVRQMPIEVVDLDTSTLNQRAVEAHNRNIRQKWGEDAKESLVAEPDFRDRVLVNYIRHWLVICDGSTYEETLNSLAGAPGYQDAREVLGQRVLAAIAEAYPELEAACQRQIACRKGAEEPHRRPMR